MVDNNTTYKDSPLGKIPVDWEVKELGKIFKLTSGRSKPKILFENPINENVYPVFGGNGIMGYSAEFNWEGEIIIIGRVGEYCGITRFLNEFCWITDNALYTKEFFADIDIKFLSYKLQQEDISKLRSKGGQPLVSQTPIAIHKIALPKSLTEQNAIAHVLGLVDSAISTNNQLIAKKKSQKKWLMQNLLTGKRRLMGYSGAWNEHKLKDCFHFIKSYSIPRDGLSREQGNQFCIHYGDIHAYYDTDFIDFKTQSGIPRINNNKVNVHPGDFLHDGDIIIADASEDYEGVGEAVEVINIQDKIVVGGLHTIVLRDFSGVTSSLFRAYLFNSERVRNELRKKATGTSVYSVTKTTLESLVFKLPPLNEQSSIANALQASDKEIQLLKAKTEKLREQKKGLMQVLLTGKKRLKYEQFKDNCL